MTDIEIIQPLPKMDWADRITALVSTMAVFGMLCGAMVISADVLMRWFTGTAIMALNEIMAQVFAVSVAATLPAGVIKRACLRVDMLAGQFGPSMSRVLLVGGSVLLAAFFGVLAWRTFGLAVRFHEQDRQTAILYWPIAPTYFFVASAFALSTLAQLWIIFQDLSQPIMNAGTRTSVYGYGLAAGFAGLLAFLVGWSVFDYGGLVSFAQSSPGTAVVIGFVLMWLAVFLQLPLAAATGIIGLLGVTVFLTWQSSGNVFANDSLEFLTNSQVATLPLFLLTGSFAVAAGVSTDIYRLAYALLGRVRGGLAYATIAACAGFGAISGSSIATAATFGRIALPEMKARGYPPSFAVGTVAAGGTLGSLVPPSGTIILFALLTQESIAKLFVAAMVPALIAVVLYFTVIYIVVRRSGLNDQAQLKPEPLLPAVISALPVIALFGVVIGGLYGGIFTTTESASVGAVGAFLLALARKKLTKERFLAVMSETTQTTALIYGLIFGAMIFSFYVNIGQAPEFAAEWIASLELSPIVFLSILIIFFVLLGAVMDSFAVMVILVPVTAPLVVGMGFDIIHFGILMLVVVELGLITPPFGINLFVLKSMERDVSLAQVMRGVIPFVIADLFKIVLLVAFPVLTLWLPSTMS